MTKRLQSSLLCRLLLLIGSLVLFLTGCASMKTPVTTIYEETRGAVLLETVQDQSFQAAHPITLDETTIANVLRGVHTKEKPGLVLLLGKALMAANYNDIRTFSEDDIAFLAPHISTALAQAAPNQRVAFRLYTTPEEHGRAAKGQETREVTAGYLSAQGLSLNLTLTHYRYRPGKIDKTQPHQLPDPDGLRNREVRFIPEKAWRKEAGSSSWFGESDDRTLAIDYHLLNKLMAFPSSSRPMLVPSAQGGQLPQPPMAPPPDAELRAFREELKAMQKRLAEQEAELERLKKSAGKP
ncbi:MAG: hypothetical protein NNA25_02035 [Nitrospira sp.]|nr:hypothetical protein [Nitrospira sp.]